MENFCRDVERSIIKDYRKTIWRPFIRGLNEYDLIQPGDRIAVCISGGKDSMLLAKCMQEILRHGKMEFGLYFLVMDPGYQAGNRKRIEENAERLGIPIQIFDSDIFNIVVDVEQSPCYLCARMRRGYLYAHAKALGCNKIALGHHFDDVIETILMSMLYGAQVNTMMPKLHSTNFPGMELIRPPFYRADREGKAPDGCGEDLEAAGDEGAYSPLSQAQPPHRNEYFKKCGECESGRLSWVCKRRRAPSFFRGI